MDLTKELERSIPFGPPPTPPAERLVAGQRALRRRRASVAVGAVAAIVALGIPGATLSIRAADGGSELTPVGPAPSAPDRPSGDDRRSEPTQSPEWPGGERDLAWVDFGTGELRISPDAVVHERRAGLFPGKGTKSVALDLSVGNRRQWVVLEWDERGGAADHVDPADASYETFHDFVAEVVRTGGVQHGPPVSGSDRSGAGR